MISFAKGKKPSILIVDDEEDIRNLIERRLLSENYELAIAANGKHALQKISSGKQFDLILCDLKMPLMTGPDFVLELRNAGFQAPIIVITGHPDKKWVESIVQSGISAVFLKPFQFPELIAKIRQLLKPKEEDGAVKESA